MRPKHITIIAIFALVVLLSGCLHNKDKETQQTTDLVSEAKLTAPTSAEPKTVEAQETAPKISAAVVGSCGNNICEENERCNFETHQTVCKEDCSLLCPGFLVAHKTEEGRTEEDFTYSCFGEGCEKIDEKDFNIIAGQESVGVKTVLTNVGEKQIENIASNFYCQEFGADFPEKATFDYGQIRGIIANDYFNNNKNKIALLGGGDSVTYYLSFNTKSIFNSTNVRCAATLRANGYRNIQDVIIRFRKPAEA